MVMKKNTNIPLYTQWPNECILVTIENILRAKYRIIFNEKQNEKLMLDARSSGLWSETKGWKFSLLYNWFTWRFKKEYWVNITVKSYNILKSNFETAYEKWEWFWIWLMYAGWWIQRVRDYKEITLEEVKNSNIYKEKYMWHNQFWKLDYIVWILRSIPYDEKLIRFKLLALREAVNKWFYQKTARTFEFEDKLLENYLVGMNKWVEFGVVESLDEKHRIAFDKAMKLRVIKKERKKLKKRGEDLEIDFVGGRVVV
jgi:hypothetical protein